MRENPFRIQLRDEFALEALETAKLYGDRVEYQDRATEARILVWAIPDEEKRSIKRVGPVQEEQTRKDFFIPRQCGFPIRNEPSINAVVYYGGFDWSVETWVEDALRSHFVLSTTRNQPRRIDDDPEG